MNLAQQIMYGIAKKVTVTKYCKLSALRWRDNYCITSAGCRL